MATPLTTVVIPVKNEDLQILRKLLYDLGQYGYRVIVVDDGSNQPVPEATIRFQPPGRGYGAALKAGIQKAQTELVCTMDGDGQHTAYDVKRLEECFIYLPENSMIIGDRRVKERGLRYFGRKFLNWTASVFANRYIPDLNSGLRLFNRNVAISYLPILCDTFSFTTSLTLAMLADGYAVDWLPIRVKDRQYGRTKVRLLQDGWTTLKYILYIGIGIRTRGVRRVWRQALGRS